jgi:uroporphyrinogen III methyltransferase/synthase
VTAAIAAAAYAGLSLTHRELASSVAFVTGHEDPLKPDASLDYPALARFPGTLVFYMGLHRLEPIATSLIAAGKDPTTPACVISRATTAHQRTVEGSLAELPARAKLAALHAPSLIVIGDCVRQREAIAWSEHRPLFGIRIGITRPAGQADGVVEQIIQLGGEPVTMPLLEILPPEDWSAVDSAIARLPQFHWLVFTSVNGVGHFLSRLWDCGRDLRDIAGLKIAAIGPATAEKLGEFHLRADVIPDEYRAEALVEALAPLSRGQRVLWAGADRGRDVLPEGLVRSGAHIEKVITYRSADAPALPAEAAELLARGELDWVALSSPAIARRFAALLPSAARTHLGTTTRLASISPVTSLAACEVGLPIAAEAEEFTWDGLIRAIVDTERVRPTPSEGEAAGL